MGMGDGEMMEEAGNRNPKIPKPESDFADARLSVVQHFWGGCGDEVVRRAASTSGRRLATVGICHDQHLPLKIPSASCQPKTMGPEPPRD